MNVISVKQDRILWIDLAKVIGIWLVILGHMHTTDTLNVYIFSFHMPLFFFLSGYLEKDRKLKEGIINGIKTLVIPYILWFLLLYVHWFFAIYLVENELNSQSLPDLLKPLAGMLFGMGYDSDYSVVPDFQIPLWFLMGLFSCKMIQQVIVTISKGRYLYYILGSTVVIGIIVLLFFTPLYIPNFFSFRCGIFAFPFFAMGYISRKKSLIPTIHKKEKGRVGLYVTLGIIGFILFYWLVPLNGRPDINYLLYGNNMILFYLIGMIGTISTIYLSFLYTRKFEIITIIANGTIFMMAFHKLLNWYLFRIIRFAGIETNLTVVLCVSLLNIVLSIIPILIIQKYFPLLIGKKK
jgi:fucose 4-O-acetylase-like acetyltransferase